MKSMVHDSKQKASGAVEQMGLRGGGVWSGPSRGSGSGGGVGTARGIAHAYGVFATGGRELGLRRETMDLLAAPAVAPSLGFYDECMKADGIQFSLGFMKSTPAFPFGGARSFGAPGAGGALGFADPDAGIGYGYVTSQMGTALTGDPRDVALRDALYAALRD